MGNRGFKGVLQSLFGRRERLCKLFSLARCHPVRRAERRCFLALFALFIIFACLFGLDDEADLRAHDKWAADMREQGAWVMW